MEPPKLIWGVAVWTAERLCRLAAGVLFFAHLFLAGRSLLGAGHGGLSAFAHLSLFVFFILLFFEHFPVRSGVLVAVVDAVGGMITLGVESIRGPRLFSLLLCSLFVIGLLSAVECFRKLPRHERW